MQVGTVITQDLGNPVGVVILQDLGEPVGIDLSQDVDDDLDSALAELDALGADTETKDKVIAALVAAGPPALTGDMETE